MCTQWTPNVQIKYFMFDWSIYRLFVLNRCGKMTLQIMILKYVCSTCSVVKLITHFDTWKPRNNVNGVCLFHLSYLKTLMAYLCSQSTPNVHIKYFMFDWSIYKLFVLNTGWKRDCFQIMIYISLLDMQRSWTKNATWNLKSKKWRKWC
jgi:hypothetical protein